QGAGGVGKGAGAHTCRGSAGRVYFGSDGASAFLRSCGNHALSEDEWLRPSPVFHKFFEHLTFAITLSNGQRPLKLTRPVVGPKRALRHYFVRDAFLRGELARKRLKETVADS